MNPQGIVSLSSADVRSSGRHLATLFLAPSNQRTARADRAREGVVRWSTPAQREAYEALERLSKKSGLGTVLRNAAQNASDLLFPAAELVPHSKEVKAAISAVDAMSVTERATFPDYLTQQPMVGTMLAGVRRAITPKAWADIHAPVAAALEERNRPFDPKSGLERNSLDPETRLRTTRHEELSDLKGTWSILRGVVRAKLQLEDTKVSLGGKFGLFEPIAAAPGRHITPEFFREHIQGELQAGDFLFAAEFEGEEAEMRHALVVVDAGDPKDPDKPLKVAHVTIAYFESNTPAVRLKELMTKKVPDGLKIETIDEHLDATPRGALAAVRAPLEPEERARGVAFLEYLARLDLQYGYAYEHLDEHLICTRLVDLFLKAARGIIVPLSDADVARWGREGRNGPPYEYNPALRAGSESYIDLEEAGAPPIPQRRVEQAGISRTLFHTIDFHLLGEIVVRTKTTWVPDVRKNEGKVVEHRSSAQEPNRS